MHVREPEFLSVELRGDARGVTPVIAIRGEAADVVRIDVHVLRCIQNGRQGQLEPKIWRLTMLIICRPTNPNLTAQASLVQVFTPGEFI